MDPVFLLFTQGLSQAIGSFSIAGVSYWNGIENRRAQEKQHFSNQAFQREQQRDAQRHQAELAWQHREFQRELSQEQHNQRKELKELDQIYLHWPLTLTPQGLVWEPEDNQVPGLTVLMSPLRISHIPVKNEVKIPPAVETEEAARSLRLFVERHYSVQSRERPVRFIGDAYKSQSIRGDASVLSIFGLLKGLPTLVLEPSLRVNGSLELRYAFWGLPDFPKRSPLQGAIALPGTGAPANESRLTISAAMQFVVSAFADSMFLVHSQGATRPLLPTLCAEGVFADGADQGTLRTQLESVLDSYASVLHGMMGVHERLARWSTLELAEDLERVGMVRSASSFLQRAIAPRAPELTESLRRSDPLADFLSAKPEVVFAKRVIELEGRLLVAPRQHSGDEESQSGNGVDRSEDSRGPLSAAIAHTVDLVSIIAALSREASSLTAGAVVLQGLGDSERALMATKHKLESPTLRIAMMGVTSAGKSTLINALLGRELAPARNDEMSAGTLRLRHSRATRVAIGTVERRTEVCPGSEAWTDHDIYQQLKTVMTEYHRKKRVTPQPMPIVEITTDVLTGNAPELLSLPQGIAQEFVDLPGLNTTDGNDANLKHLIEEAADCFCVVILDYKDTTDRNSCIFEKLRDTVTAMNPDGADILFVLNKFLDSHDRHETAEEVAALIESKQAEIQHELGLATRPQVVLLEAKLWCDVQLAWGPVSLTLGTSDSRISPEARKRCIENCMQFYSGHISKFVKGDQELSAWWRAHRDMEELSDEALRFFLERIVYPLTGADVFLATLRSRIESRLGALVVRPVFRSSLGVAEIAIGRVSTAATVGSQHSLEAVETVASSLTTMVDTVRRNVDERWNSVRDMCVEMSNVFVDEGGDGRSADTREREFLKRIKALPPSYWESLGSLWTNITSLKQNSRKVLEAGLCEPLGLVWERCQSGGMLNITRTCDDVVRQLADAGLSRLRSESLVSCYTKYALTVSEWRTEGSWKAIEYQDGHSRPGAAVEADEHLQKLAAELEMAIGELMRRFLRLQGRQIEDSVRKMLLDLQKAAEESAASEGMSASVFAGVTGLWATEDFAEHLEVPAGLFEIQLLATEKDETRSELDRIGTKQVRDWRTLWLFMRTVEERFYKDVKYHIVKCPTVDELGKRCLDVQSREYERVGQILTSWARDTLEKWQTSMVLAADKLKEIIEQEAESYRGLAAGGLRGRAARWQQVAAMAERGTKTIDQIEELC